MFSTFLLEISGSNLYEDSVSHNPIARYKHKFKQVQGVYFGHTQHKIQHITRFFYKQRFFSTQSQCCFTFSWIQLQMLLSCCLIHKSIIILRHFLYLLSLCPCLKLSLFLSYLCDLFFIFIFIFITINHMNTDTYALFVIF